MPGDLPKSYVVDLAVCLLGLLTAVAVASYAVGRVRGEADLRRSVRWLCPPGASTCVCRVPEIPVTPDAGDHP